MDELISVAQLKKGQVAIITKISEDYLPANSGLLEGEVEASLLEMGFIEGATLKVMHVGIIGGEPIAVRINNSNNIVALRKNTAATILVEVR